MTENPTARARARPCWQPTVGIGPQGGAARSYLVSLLLASRRVGSSWLQRHKALLLFPAKTARRTSSLRALVTASCRRSNLSCGVSGYLLGKFIADAPQLRPFLSRGKPAELFQSVETVDCGHGGDFFVQGTQYRGHESGTHVVPQAGVAVGKLVKQATVFLAKMFEVRWGETTLLQVNQGIG